MNSSQPLEPNNNHQHTAEGWTFEPLDEGKIRASNENLCNEYAAMDEYDLLAISAQWRNMANRFIEATKKTGHYHGHIVHDDEVLKITKILETALSQYKIDGVSSLGRCLRRPDDGHLHWALAALDKLDAKLRVEASCKTAKKIKNRGIGRKPVKSIVKGKCDLVFISYSHKDIRWLNDLQTHLKPYMRDGSVVAWSDKQIQPSSKWLPEIKKALNSTKVAVLLVTPNFLASDFIHQHELTPLLNEARKGGVRILWIPIRACAYKKTLLKEYQSACNPDKPLANMKAERDQAWVTVCEAIEKLIIK